MSEAKQGLEDNGHDAVFGWIVVVAGFCLIGWGALFDATIATSSPYLDERIFNLGELAKKLIILGAGGFTVLIGTVILAAYGVRSDLRKMANREAPSQPAAE